MKKLKIKMVVMVVGVVQFVYSLYSFLLTTFFSVILVTKRIVAIVFVHDKMKGFY